MSDKLLRQDVVDALDFEPSINAADIGIAVDQGVVTLTGHVRSYMERRTAIDTVENVHGVRAIADELEVRPVGDHITADDEIAIRILNTLQWNTSIPEDRIHVTVSKGRVTLTGEVEWRYQSAAAQRAVSAIAGVTQINNHLKVMPSLRPSDVSDRIRQALLRGAELDASSISVTVADDTVTLEGKVRNIAERRTAERAAWSVPGVKKVIDHLAVP